MFRSRRRLAADKICRSYGALGSKLLAVATNISLLTELRALRKRARSKGTRSEPGATATGFFPIREFVANPSKSQIQIQIPNPRNTLPTGRVSAYFSKINNEQRTNLSVSSNHFILKDKPHRMYQIAQNAQNAQTAHNRAPLVTTEGWQPLPLTGWFSCEVKRQSLSPDRPENRVAHYIPHSAIGIPHSAVAR